MLRDDLPRADLSRHVERDLLLKPGGHDHARSLVLNVADGARNYVPNAVDEPDVHLDAAVKHDGDRLFGNEFRLGGHDGLAGGGLRKLVVCTLTLEIVGDVRDNQGVHQPCDECRFAGTHRAYDTEINVAASPACDVRIN